MSPYVSKREPVVLLVLIAVLTEAGGAVVLLANDQTLTGMLVAVGAFLTGAAGALARSLVTPLARPNLPVALAPEDERYR